MTLRTLYTVVGLFIAAEASATPVEMAGAALSAAPMPLDIGGFSAIAAVSLIIGTQLIKSRK